MERRRGAKIVLLLAAISCSAPAESSKQGPAPADAAARKLIPAAGLLQAGRFGDAANAVAAIVAADPSNAQAWRLLGDASLKAGKPDAALTAYERLLALEPDSPRALYGIGVVHALRRDNDGAFESLLKAKQTHRIDMSAIEADAHLATLKGDPRFKALLPQAEDFAHPFVEDVRIIREWRGEGANDQFGWIARGIGDVDGDGVPDFTTSAPTNNSGGEQSGRVYVYSTRTGKLLWSVDGKANDQLGTGLESAGDTDGDGIEDVIASAPGSATAYVYSGKDGHVLLTLHGEAQADNFGNHVASVGDIDHDGHADVIVGAPSNKAHGDDTGRAYVYSGKDGRLLLTLTGEHAGDQFGSAVTGYTAGSQRFLVVGAPNAGSRKAGRVYVYDGLSQKPKFTFDADASGSKLGYMFLTVLGDVDGDGIPDIYASDWSNSARGPSTGRIYVYSGKSGKRLYALTGETAGEGFGTTHAFAGDVDGDGRADLIVGSWQYAGAAISGGRAYLFSGRDARLLKTYTCRTPGDTFGFDAVALGDVDGDGDSDLLITSGWSAVNGFHSGRVFLISSGVTNGH